ncbi:hypothetical protein LOD99_353 [Oopsacas minuta]|uniref:Uncharacterized protein n=1 Tax=Oopsacas minuta TaxID=111878 RepID=A0AAV7KA89_9METZ|nr:hypothetical protein LOD99_353 [Oopsacas minuta]
MELALRGWIGLVGGIALINGLNCFRNPEVIQENVYSKHPEASDMAVRLFGVWNIMSAIVRIGCAWDFNNIALQSITELSFLIAFLYFSLETTVYKTISFTPGVIAPIIISSITPLAMIAYSLS